MKIGVYADEWYPVWCLCSKDGWLANKEIEATEEEAKEWERIANEFDKIQDIIAHRIKDIGESNGNAK